MHIMHEQTTKELVYPLVKEISEYVYLFPFVLVALESLHSDWLTGVVHETMHHACEPIRMQGFEGNKYKGE